jgi:two-component sensor histidine kinase
VSAFLRPEVSDELVWGAEVLTNELVTNSVVHSDLGPDERIRMDLDLDPARLRITVTDAPGEFPSDIGPKNGFGLVLVERLSDRWGIERAAQNQVWFELDR